MDMAVGIIVGSAFTSIVNSLVKDIIMPVVSTITGGIDYSAWFVALDGNKYATAAAAAEAGAATLNYGMFISYVINFIIVAFVLFLVINEQNEKACTRCRRSAYNKGMSLLQERNLY